MLVTPPDVISQTILALPMYLLFEAGVLASRLIRTQEAEASEAD
jgi:sec-independent protein translocase protein TatC